MRVLLFCVAMLAAANLSAQAPSAAKAPSALTAILRSTGWKVDVHGPAGREQYSLKGENYSLEFSVGESSYRLRYFPACKTEEKRIQEFLRDSAFVKAFLDGDDRLVLEGHLLLVANPSSEAIQSFLSEFRRQVERFLAGPGKFCVVTPRLLEESSEVQSKHGRFRIRLNLADWKPRPGTSENIQQFVHRNGEIHLLMLSERISVAKDSLSTIAITNAKNLDPKAKIAKQELLKLGGREVLGLEMTAEQSGISFRFVGRYYAGSSGTLQLVAYSAADQIESHRKIIAEVFETLEISDEEKAGSYLKGDPSQSRMSLEILGGRAAMDYSNTDWRLTKDDEGRKEWSDSSGVATAILISEKLTITGENLAELAVKRMESSAERYKVKEIKSEARNGVAMTCVDAEFTRSKLDFVYRGCFWGADKAAVQLIGIAVAENATEALPKLEEFWKGFRFIPKLLP